MQFPASTLEGDYMAIKHGIKNERHNFIKNGKRRNLIMSTLGAISKAKVAEEVITHRPCPELFGPKPGIQHDGRGRGVLTLT